MSGSDDWDDELPDPTSQSTSSSWEDLFPYSDPYDQQVEGIEEVRQTADNDGFTLLEGACGTGKTLIALMAGIEAVRDPNSKYQRVLCMTSVKQQLKAFEDDLRSINANLSDGTPPVSALSLVGKADVCSYVQSGHIDHGDIYGTCETLRDQVRRRVNNANDEVAELNDILGAWETTNGATLDGDGWTTRYRHRDPTDDDTPTGCAFYAKFLRENRLTAEDEPVMHLSGVHTPDELVEKASDQGLCPHAVMTDALDTVEVLIGNYYHAFDPVTVQSMTGALLDETTFVVCDEAHTVVSVVRDLLTQNVSLYSFDQTLYEIDDFILNPSREDEAVQEQILLELQEMMETTPRNAKRQVMAYRNLVDDLREKLLEYADDAVQNEFGRGWESELARSSRDDLPRTIEHPLRDADTPGQDTITEWIESTSYDDTWENIEVIGEYIGEAIRETSKIRSDFNRTRTYADTIGRVFGYWRDADHKAHFREVELERRRETWNNPETPWHEVYRVQFSVKNCIPHEGISATLDQFGGGILMSATLEPFEVFRKVTGMNKLADDRPITELSYGLTFPEENRASYIVDAPKFTNSNRGNPYDGMNPTRDQYLEIIKDVVVSTAGNVLICMPNYSEAKWAAWKLRDESAAPEVEKEILLDESSTNAATEQLKQDFFDGTSKVLVTSMRGTLTEGVDYDGDRLAACLVCGLPIRTMGSPHANAIEAAYKDEFGDFHGFAYGFAVPALRKARQALGRVIRSDDDVGVRVVADERYVSGSYLQDFLPEYEREEYEEVPADDLRPTLRSFWRHVEH